MSERSRKSAKRVASASDDEWRPEADRDAPSLTASDEGSDSDFEPPSQPARQHAARIAARHELDSQRLSSGSGGRRQSAGGDGFASQASSTAVVAATSAAAAAEPCAPMATQASDAAAAAKPTVSSLAEGDANVAADAVEGTPEETPEKNKAKRKRTKKPKETAEERLHRLHPEVKGVWQTISAPSGIIPVEQPQRLLVKLLPFQLEGVSWMLHQEEFSEFRGGILADEMGMGKTIQTIALLLSRRGPSGQPTMVVCPTVAMLQWKGELLARTRPDSLKVLVYHGSTRDREASELQKFDVILTTYATIESEWRRQQSGFQRKGKKVFEPSVVHSIHYFRVILDEAHFIKDRSSSTARAMFGLQRTHGWLLSGTPLQNRVGELFSLVKFLQADPYSYYFCRQCECKSHRWLCVNSRRCSECGHASMSHFCWWNREILRNILKYGHEGPGREAFDNLRKLLTSMMLRRTKVERGSELGLPPRVVHTRRDLFSHEEEDFYEALFSETKTRFEGFVRTGTVLNNYAHIFELLMRMRQSVNHPWLVTHRRDSKGDRDVCGICHEQAEDPIQTACKHTFCREEMSLYVTSDASEHPVCPVCFRELSVDLTQPAVEPEEPDPSAKARKGRTNIVRRLDIEAWRSSTKIEALLEELTACKTESASIKSIVFSQFTTFLDLLEWRLQRAGVRCVKLDGRMQPTHRAAVIEAFNTKPEITVFLISLKAGGLALNLTAASRVYIMDPWWNPAAESQAMDRIHRLGQNRPVEVRRLIIENSIESRIDQLQEKKRLLFESTVGMDASALSRLTEEDLRFLFF